ncbi:ribonuclease E inhibitor RraB [Paraburkholderia haematera]|uniref:Uncharacterized protein n=1 Tax=Paraburkholderia haematera TaxID=2793077 RepID=A0ABM8QBD9_9BURK|nr:ribonuclease E inhibitor RraB [Paraburkholderia haematera]CAE6688006.1 hypothetical protein R69888_00079 [Paraburkholderia haematera]
MNKTIEPILRNCVEPELVRDPDCWMWLNELQSKLSSEDAEGVSGVIAEMRERRAKPKEQRLISHSGSIWSKEVDESFEEWLTENGCGEIFTAQYPDGGWLVCFLENAPDSFHELVESCQAIHGKFTEFGGEYDGWNFLGRFMVSHRVTQK